MIDVENILRRLRENARSEHRRPTLEVVLDASMEVRSAVVYATFAVALVFVPVLTMSGVAGKMFAPLGVAYITSILASLLVALTVTPALSLIFLAKYGEVESKSPVAEWLQRSYKNLLQKIEKRHRLVVAVTALLTLCGFAMLPFLKTEFLPEFREGHFVAHVIALPGTSLAESQRIGREITQELTKLPFVRIVAQRVGRAEQADDTWGTHYSEIEIDLKPIDGTDAVRAEEQIRATLASVPGVSASLKTFLAERIEETISGYTSSVVIQVYDNDLTDLDSQAAKVQAVVADIPGARDVQLQSPPGMPEVAIKLRHRDLERWGLNPVATLDAIRTSFGGDDVGQVYEGNQVFGVRLILPPSKRTEPEEIGDLLVRNDNGVYVRLSQVADVYQTPGRFSVLHDSARRV